MTINPVGRNEPCPCGSGKKYKRCHGFEKISLSDASNSVAQTKSPEMPGNVSPEMMTQMAGVLQKLPKGQMQRLKGLMMKAMIGKDVSQEMSALEKELPVEVQQMFLNLAQKLPENPAEQADVKKSKKWWKIFS